MALSSLGERAEHLRWLPFRQEGLGCRQLNQPPLARSLPERPRTCPGPAWHTQVPTHTVKGMRMIAQRRLATWEGFTHPESGSGLGPGPQPGLPPGAVGGLGGRRDPDQGQFVPRRFSETHTTHSQTSDQETHIPPPACPREASNGEPLPWPPAPPPVPQAGSRPLPGAPPHFQLPGLASALSFPVLVLASSFPGSRLTPSGPHRPFSAQPRTHFPPGAAGPPAGSTVYG